MNLKDKIWFYLLGGKWPEDKGYTVLDGFVSGDFLRLESFSGGELWIDFKNPPPNLPIQLWFHATDGQPGRGWILKGTKPFEWDGRIWSVSPIQKKSYYGWLRTSPKSYWYWNMKKLQDKDENGNWIAGTEKGFCYRSTPCWRVDFPGTDLDGQLRHWIPSGGHLSFRRYD